jgi:UDP-N-acetyl-D-galactosamine dehydrogenase
MPGLVGGHCIGVDPYYLTYKAQSLGYNPEVILSGRRINDDMGPYVAKRCIQLMAHEGKDVVHSRVLVMGATFKENVSDVRNSKVADIIKELKDFSVTVDVVDPHADSHELQEEYGFSLITEPAKNYDAIIVAVNHNDYMNLDENYFKGITTDKAVFMDIKGVFRNKIKGITYWSL